MSPRVIPPGSVLSLPAAGQREQTLDRFHRERFDLVVIGGGITGAGIAYEASLRGLSVALLEASDYAAGTSSRSSKLIHGGFRYLGRLELGIVRRVALERQRIHQLAPHLTIPRWLLLPISNRSNFLFYRGAVRIYEMLGALEKQDCHHSLVGQQIEQFEPVVDLNRFRFGVAFREYLTDDARLVLANLRAAVGKGAVVVNHARVTGIDHSNGTSKVKVRCAIKHHDIEIRARTVINAAGPWVEEIQQLEDQKANPVLHLSKGIHIALPADRLPLRSGLVLYGKDRRYMVAIRRGSIVYVGPTDTTYGAQASHWPGIAQQDVDYILRSLNQNLNVPQIKSSEVIGAWAGLRPLLADPKRNNPSEISRRDELIVGKTGMISVAGGKLSGYRDMARNVLREIEKQWQCSIEAPKQQEAPLPGGDFDGDISAMIDKLRVQSNSNLNTDYCKRLVQLYGCEAGQILKLDARPINWDLGPPAIYGEIDWAIAYEGAVTLEDVVYRRMRLPLYEPRAKAAIKPIALRMAQLLDWNQSEVDRQLDQIHHRMNNDINFA